MKRLRLIVHFDKPGQNTCLELEGPLVEAAAKAAAAAIWKVIEGADRESGHSIGTTRSSSSTEAIAGEDLERPPLDKVGR